jgi:hypothetical protein
VKNSYSTHNTNKMTETDRILAYADQIESLGIVKEWLGKAPSYNSQLHRLTHLMMQQALYVNRLEMYIEDLKFLNSEIMEKKNKDIINLKKQYGF